MRIIKMVLQDVVESPKENGRLLHLIQLTYRSYGLFRQKNEIVDIIGYKDPYSDYYWGNDVSGKSHFTHNQDTLRYFILSKKKVWEPK